jgi:hypothetical protein
VTILLHTTVLSLETHHLHTRHSTRYTTLVDGILTQAEELARSWSYSSNNTNANALHPFRYGNYAAKGQDVWGLLLNDNNNNNKTKTKTKREKEKDKESHWRRVDLVRDVQRRYDPSGVWGRMVSGGFRIRT